MNSMNRPGDSAARAEQTPAVLAALERVEARLARLESAIDRVEREGMNGVAMLTDTFDRWARERDLSDIEERTRALLSLLERMSRPETLAQLEQIIDLLEQTPGLISTIVDTIDGKVARLADRDINVDDRIRALAPILERLTSPEASAFLHDVLLHVGELHKLLISGVLSVDAVETVGRLGRALSEAAAGEPASVGALGLLRAMRDQDVRASLGFGVEVARRFGSTSTAAVGTPAELTSGTRERGNQDG